MNDAASLENNRRFLVAAVAWLRALLERHAADAGVSSRQALDVARAAATVPPLLDRLSERLGLTSFESDVLLLCAAVELDGQLPAACAAASGDQRRSHPTFGLALAALPGGHWSAIAPSGPLRRHRLIELDALTDGMVHGRLRIDERILHYLTGTGELDARLDGLVMPLPDAGHALTNSQRAVADRLRALMLGDEGERPLVQLCGDDPAGKLAIAARAMGELGLPLYWMRAADVPAQPQERELLARLWSREQMLSPVALLFELDDADQPENRRALAALVERLTGPLLVATRDPLRLPHRLGVRLDVPRPPNDEQAALWQATLGDAARTLNGAVGALASHFSLSVPAMRAAYLDAVERMAKRDGDGSGGDDLGALLWDACRVQARPRLDDLAQRIDAVVGWDDLVLPPLQKRLLQDLAAHVRQRARVYDAWGFGRRAAGLGITALFSGVSGTGKTLAAEVLARELRLDLYRVDLSQVVSKYIGETEKNLRRIFDAAEEGGVILLFDEADALFGKRSEVKDSHDRYANLEVSYLLQRMEAYRGLAILTTNMRTALDVAFVRRLRFIAEFPFPDVKQRAEIWARVFPQETPVQSLDVEKLARLHVAGGTIHNIALHAAFSAADESAPVQMRHLLHAARVEFIKIERQLNEHEVGGWT